MGRLLLLRVKRGQAAKSWIARKDGLTVKLCRSKKQGGQEVRLPAKRRVARKDWLAAKRLVVAKRGGEKLHKFAKCG